MTNNFVLVFGARIELTFPVLISDYYSEITSLRTRLLMPRPLPSQGHCQSRYSISRVTGYCPLRGYIPSKDVTILSEMTEYANVFVYVLLFIHFCYTLFTTSTLLRHSFCKDWSSQWRRYNHGIYHYVWPIPFQIYCSPPQIVHISSNSQNTAAPFGIVLQLHDLVFRSCLRRQPSD